MRNFDATQQSQSVKTSAVEAVKSIFPVVGKIRTMRLDNVWVEEKADLNDFAAQAKTKTQEGTWGVPVYASLSLVENASGKVIDKAPKIRLFLLPMVTERSSYIVAGNEYQVNNQLRLKTGVYTIRKQNGELKTQVNLARGKNFDLGFNEASGVFTLQKVGGGQTNIPLYPILTYLGISPSLISQTWGARLESVNQRADPKSVARAETAFNAKKNGLSEYFKKTEISGDTTKMVLGTSYDKVDGPMLLACSKNLLDVQLGKKDPVDRDSLAFKELHSIEDFIKERLEKNKGELVYKIQRQIDVLRRTKVTQIVNPGLFSGVVQSFFTQDDKSSTPEQTNPLEMLSGAYKATFMGSGGITSHHAIKDEMRQIHPSHYGFIDPVHTPESDRIGVNLHLPTGVVKDGKDLRVQLNNAKSGARELLNVTESWEKYVAFPGQKGDILKAMYQGKIVSVPRSKIDFFTPHAAMLFSPSTNLVPFLPANQGNRAMMASKMLEQAIGLKHREAPLVQVGITPEMSMEQFVGKDIAAHAPDAGTVKKVTDDFITLATAKGDVKINTYNNFTLNRKSFLNHTALVKEGDTVAKGQLLAESNYTRGGTLALGTNLRAAYIPYKGYNFEDGIVISQSASEKLTSEHIYKKTYEISPNSVMKLPSFRAFYPNAVTAANAAKLDAEGVIKKGQRVKTGDVIIAALQKRTPDARIAVVSRTLAERPKDASIYWTAEDEGVVTEVQKSSGSVSVFIKTEERARIGDKLSGRMGNKGIITKILPDSQTPRDGSGKPVDILLNPHGVIGRINIGQIYESAAGKAALKNGAPYKVENFTGQNYLGTTRKFLKQSGVKDKEELFDPETGKSLGNVHVGNPYILKLFKQSAGNFSVRQGGPGSTYDVNMQPVKSGGEEGSKSLDLLTMYSMLSHGARANLQEMSTLKSNQNDEYWKALRGGQQLPPPKAPFIYDKFIAYLKGAGIDVVKDGTKSTLGPLTDSHALEMSSGAVQKPHFYHAKDFQPVKGGFFDTRVFGGIAGKKWGHLDLKEPVVNPVFEDAARNLLGLSGKFDEVVGGRLFVQKDGSLGKESAGGLTAGAGIERLLKNIDVDAQLGSLTKKANNLTGTKLNDVNKKLRYLTALKTLNLKPHEAYIRRNMAVLPPVYRPIYPLPNGDMASSDVNTLYQKVGVINSMMHLPVMALLPEGEKANIRQDLYNHVKGVAGLMDVTIKGKPKDGLIAQIKGGTGGQPKEGLFISKLLSKQQDFVGRGTIIPEPSLGIDEMAMPEDMAWKLFEPFVVRELKSMGKNPLQAKEEIKKRTALAKRALEIAMSSRHVLLNRAPSLHKFSIMAFKPKITDGKALKIPPLIVKGFNADYDGDTMTVHTPISDEANREAALLLPSKNLFQPGTGALMIQPSQEAQIGLFYLSQTPAGRQKINALLPDKYKITAVLDKKSTGTLTVALAKELPANQYGPIVAALKAEGEKHAFERGFTLGMDDIAQFGAMRDRIVDAADKAAKKAKTPEELMSVNKRASSLIDKMIDHKLVGKDNPLYDMVQSGARGNSSQLRQIIASPLFMSDEKGRIVPTAIKKSYAEGLDIGDYWISMYGARRGMMDRAIQTSLPGAFSKDIMATTINNVVSMEDCGTHEGVTHKLDDKDVFDRYMAGDQGGYSHNTLVDTRVLSDLKKRGLLQVKVRSPLRCLAPKGTCAKCYGIDEHGGPPSVGDNIGAKAGQTMSEPLIQMVMRTFHTGGAAGTGADAQGYARVDQLLQMPKIVVGAAPLAAKAGKVTKITKGLGGGFDVTLDDTIYHVPIGKPLKVSVGSRVAIGDPLSEGVIRPQDLVKLKGMDAAQDYIAGELQKSYQGQGINLHRKIFETVVRSLGNTTQVQNNPKGTGYLPGDIVPYTVAQHYNRNLEVTKSPDDAVGYKLSKATEGMREGHTITQADADLMRARGLKELDMKKDPLIHAPLLKSLKSLPLLSKDWMASLGYQQLQKALTLGAGQGWSTDTAGYHPIPAFAQGVAFGKGKDGKY